MVIFLVDLISFKEQVVTQVNLFECFTYSFKKSLDYSNYSCTSEKLGLFKQPPFLECSAGKGTEERPAILQRSSFFFFFLHFYKWFCCFFGAGERRSLLALSFNTGSYHLSAAAALGIVRLKALRPLWKGRISAPRCFTFILNFASADFASAAHSQLHRKPHFPFCSILRFAPWMGE